MSEYLISIFNITENHWESDILNCISKGISRKHALYADAFKKKFEEKCITSS